MIILYKPYIEKKDKSSRLIFDFDINKKRKTVWFEVENIYKKYLCDDRVDAILVGILLYAMKKGHNIKSDSYITEELLFKINEYLIPSLVKYGNNLKKIKIDIPTTSTVKNDGGVGTGCSCGIDSMHAILTKINNKSSQFDLTHICINNVGAFNECYKESGIEKVKVERIKKSKEFAKEIGLPIIITDSNFQEEIKQDHLLTHTYSSTFAILCLQKLWKVYYYGSSGLDFSSFSLINNDDNPCADYELLSLDCFSTNSLKIYSEGGAKSRLEKTKDIYKHKLVKDYLHVCTKKEYNCSRCPKCMRTILSLYALTDDLLKYNKVFDIDYFYKNKNEYFEYLYASHLCKEEMNEPTYYELLTKDDFKEFVESKEKKVEPDEEYNFYKEEYERVINSKTFKVGNIIMKIPRKLKSIIKK